MGKQSDVHRRFHTGHCTGHNARVVPSLNLEHLVCLCPKIHGFLRLGDRSGGLDRHIQRDRHARRNAAQNAAVRHVIAGGYIWVETLSYVAAGLLLLAFWKVEKDLAARQKT